MGYANVSRLLDVAVGEGYVLSGQTYSVSTDTVIAGAGSYFVNASSGPVVMEIDKRLNRNGLLVNVKKIDTTGNPITIQAPTGGSIDGEQTADVVVPFENLQIQYHEGHWYIL